MKNNELLAELQPFLQEKWQKAGFEDLTDIQRKAIPAILTGKDLMAMSPTGTGKTLAYMLPLLEKIDKEMKSIQILIMAPSRELVAQIHDVALKWTEGSGIASASLVGGANIKRQVEKLKKKPQMVIGTPGRVQELIQLKKLKMHEIRTIVLDEGDQLLGKEHLDTVRMIVKSAMRDRQLLLFSATKLADAEQVEAMLGRTPDELEASSQESVPATIKHYYLSCEPREKTKLLGKLARLEDIKALVFVRSVGNMNVIADKLAYEGISAGMLHSEMDKRSREKAIKDLHAGTKPLLLATDIAARGLDIEGLNCVIQYDLAEDARQYVHRAGRTGRMGAEGTVVSLVNPRDERELNKYGKELGIPIQQKRLYQGQLADAVNKSKKK